MIPTTSPAAAPATSGNARRVIRSELLKRNGLTSRDLALVVPHQANLRIIRAMQERLGVDESKISVNSGAGKMRPSLRSER